MMLAVLVATIASAEPGLLPYPIEGDGIPAPLTGRRGDPAEGRKIVANRQVGTCLLCHSAPIPEERFQGTIGPDLKGVGARLAEPELRLRIVDPSRANKDTVMPSYYSLAGRTRVGKPWEGKPILTAEQVEDVVSYLATLKE
jgi:L-cysteine S-thiosulfotransferase